MDTESQTATKQLTYKVRYPILWRLIIFFIALCSTIIVLICAVFVFVNTQIGRNYIADKIEQTTDGHIRIQGLSGFSPSDLTIAQIQFNNDAVGVWAEVKEVQLKWSPLALLSNEISIRSLVAKEIDFTIYHQSLKKQIITLLKQNIDLLIYPIKLIFNIFK